mmetsp:Transcript_81706/g.236885  ORF Transcript_81706/g.236885 Transcript_81706/m.236885 type:complete len:378 (+) Transcript_81706:1251-2384(+)
MEGQKLGLRRWILFRGLRRLPISANVRPLQVASDLAANIDGLVAADTEHDHAVRLRRELTATRLNQEASGLEEVSRLPPVAQDVLRCVIHEHEHSRCPCSERTTIEVQDLDGQCSAAARNWRISLNRQVAGEHRVDARLIRVRIVALRTQLEHQLLCSPPILEHFDSHRALVAFGFERCECEVQEGGALRLQDALCRRHRENLEVVVVHVEGEDRLHVDSPWGGYATAVRQLDGLHCATLNAQRHWLQCDDRRADREATNIGRHAVRLQVQQDGPPIMHVEDDWQDVRTNAVVMVCHLDIHEITWQDLAAPRLNIIDVVLLDPREVSLAIVNKGLLVAPIRRVLQVEVLRRLEGEADLQVARVRECQVDHRRSRPGG